MATREGDRALELDFAVHLRDADRGAEPCRLDEHRVREGVLGPVSVAQRDVAGDGDSAIPEHRLEQVLVHAQRGRRDACADVGDACQLEEPLHGSVLPVRAVEDGEDDVDATEDLRRRRGRDDRERLDIRHA